jgi:hypothetical protein
MEKGDLEEAKVTRLGVRSANIFSVFAMGSLRGI